MKKTKPIYIFVCLLFLITLLSAQDTLVTKALQIFETRYENANHIWTSAQMLESVAASDPNNLVANHKLSQIYYTIADHSPTKSEKLYYFEKGIDYAKKAIKIDYNSVWSHFWYMANLGAATQLKGIFSSLTSVSEVKKETEIVLGIEPNNVWALNAKANVYYELPGVLGGDLNKSIEILNRAIQIDSNYSILYISMAKTYIKKKDYNNARLYLNKVLALENPWPLADFLIDDKPNAMALLSQIAGK